MANANSEIEGIINMKKTTGKTHCIDPHKEGRYNKYRNMAACQNIENEETLPRVVSLADFVYKAVRTKEPLCTHCVSRVYKDVEYYVSDQYTPPDSNLVAMFIMQHVK